QGHPSALRSVLVVQAALDRLVLDHSTNSFSKPIRALQQSRIFRDEIFSNFSPTLTNRSRPNFVAFAPEPPQDLIVVTRFVRAWTFHLIDLDRHVGSLPEPLKSFFGREGTNDLPTYPPLSAVVVHFLHHKK